ncbi:MAG: CDP-glycerol glycerophosphotransferase family protein [Candidatus Marinimicrobia bacterium]|nr:CDP-glycerol glycerophosphotransferase family protein [Candidatus Neomarinimicrobiota bacterium]
MKKYLHFLTRPYSISVVKPLIEEIHRSSHGISLCFATESVLPYLMGDFSVTNSIQEAIAFQPDVVFIPGNVVYHKIPGLKVQVFHGLCEEKGGHYKITGFFDLYCTSGPLITEKFRVLSEKYRHFKVVETGWPKVDSILNEFDRRKICRSLGIDEQKKLIFYAPTFSPKFKSSDFILPVLPGLPKENETWIVKFHDLMNIADKRRFLDLPQDKFIIYNSPDNIPLLQVADVLISDTSSIVYEFMLLDKPVVTLNAQVRIDKGINITESSQLRSAIDRSLSFPGEFSENRKTALRRIHPYSDRRNSVRVLSAVDNALETNLLSGLKHKPINLYRKFQVWRSIERQSI